MKILVIPGSLRSGSYNKSLAKAVLKVNLEDVEFIYRELNDIPMFNQDLEEDLPQSVQEIIEDAKSSDAFIIATPEYNNTTPAPVANIMHWLSRSYSREAIAGKPIAIMGATDGGFGTVRSQNHLLLMAAIIGFRVNSLHRLPVSKAQNVFSEQGEMVDEEMKSKFETFLKKFVDDVRRETTK